MIELQANLLIVSRFKIELATEHRYRKNVIATVVQFESRIVLLNTQVRDNICIKNEYFE